MIVALITLSLVILLLLLFIAFILHENKEERMELQKMIKANTLTEFQFTSGNPQPTKPNNWLKEKIDHANQERHETY